jgi:hypothetical protein
MSKSVDDVLDFVPRQGPGFPNVTTPANAGVWISEDDTEVAVIASDVY